MSSESVGDLLREIDDEREEARHWLMEFNRMAKENERLWAVIQDEVIYHHNNAIFYGAGRSALLAEEHERRAKLLELALNGEK